LIDFYDLGYRLFTYLIQRTYRKSARPENPIVVLLQIRGDTSLSCRPIGNDHKLTLRVFPTVWNSPKADTHEVFFNPRFRELVPSRSQEVDGRSKSRKFFRSRNLSEFQSSNKLHVLPSMTLCQFSEFQSSA